ncbi:MAG: xylose isomerase [Planctomycetota bacterium]
MSTVYFPAVADKVRFEGSDSTNPLSFKHYDPEAVIAGKSMREHLRFAACMWHCMKQTCADPFGVGTRQLPWEQADDAMTAAHQAIDAMFEFCTKLDIDFWCFHDRDIAPEMGTLKESHAALETIVKYAKTKQDETGVKLLWGTACLFIHPRFMAGAGTAPCPEVFAHAAAQVRQALDATKELGGAGYVFWGGREGYDTLLNTDLGRDLDHLAKLLHLAVDYKKSIGLDVPFYIEPKPKEPTTHQYDHDASACHAFLMKYGLTDHFKLNIEANHATLAGHSFHHELEYCRVNDLLGSIDANRGGEGIGWDTDQFPTNLYDTTLAMLTVLRAGGFTTGGLNFDAKVRRQSTETIDLIHAHIGGMDAFARGLKAAAKIIEDGRIDELVTTRYAGWDSELGRDIEAGKLTLANLDEVAQQQEVQTAPVGRQELIENLFNDYL